MRIVRVPSLVLLVLLVLAACIRSPDRGLLFRPGDPFWATRGPDAFRARFETTKGPFVIEVTRDRAPRGADRFYQLVRAGFFDDSRFFRVVPEFIVQFGIAGDPEVTRLWQDRTFPDDPEREQNLPARSPLP